MRVIHLLVAFLASVHASLDAPPHQSLALGVTDVLQNLEGNQEFTVRVGKRYYTAVSNI